MNMRENEHAVVADPSAQACTPAPREDARVIAALEEYLATLEAGQQLDRHEFLARHAAITDVLAEYLDSLELVHIAAPQLHQSASLPSPPDSAGGLCSEIPENDKIAKIDSCLASPDYHFSEFRSKAGRFDAKGADALFGQVFREAGLDVEALPAEEAGERIRRSTVAAELAAVLDEWARIRRTIRGAEDPSWKALLRVAQEADPDAWRSRVREALAERDREALRGVAASEEAFRLPAALLSFLGSALQEDKEARGQAEAFLREAQRRRPNDFWVNEDLFWFFTVVQPSPREDALRFATAAVALRPQSPGAHNNLGYILRDKGRLDEAIAEFRQAIRLKDDFVGAHINLGRALMGKGQLDEAIRLKKDYAHVHYHLGLALMQKGRFPQAVDALRRGHELSSHDPHWSCSSEQWLRNAERLADLDARLPALLQGEAQPADTGERLALAQLCQRHKKLYAASARWYGEVFAAQPALADDLASGNRYNAACAAALAGCGQDQDAAELDEDQRARLRRQALDWLRADVEAWRRLLAKSPEKVRLVLIKQLRHWQDDPDLAGIREREALAKLPETERTEWKRLWQEVAALRQRAAAPPKTTAPIRTNDGPTRGQPGP